MTLHQPSAAVGFGAQQRGVNVQGPAILSDADIENDHGQSVVLQHVLLSQIEEFIEVSGYHAATVTSAEGGGGVLRCVDGQLPAFGYMIDGAEQFEPS
jgi:hypothetical protein